MVTLKVLCNKRSLLEVELWDSASFIQVSTKDNKNVAVLRVLIALN